MLGYRAGRALLGDTWRRPPPEPLLREAVAIAVVSLGEEAVWGRHVEPEAGPIVTSALFAAKHVAIDGRWRRVLGLALFWLGLALVRRRSRALATGVHVTLDVGGVLVGHLSGEDQF